MKRKHDNGFPARDAIVAFIRANPGKIGTREIAREFGLNADRIELKRILRELADDGTIAKRGKKIHEPAALPPTVMADITGRDADGELLATPTEWDEEENGAAPKKAAAKIADPDAPKPAKKAAVKKAAAKPKTDAVSKARAPVASAAKTSAAKPAAKTPAKKSAGKARG